MKTINIPRLALILLMEKSAMADGINTEQKKTMAIAEIVSKMKSFKNQELKKTLILISCLTAKELVNKQI